LSPIPIWKSNSVRSFLLASAASAHCGLIKRSKCKSLHSQQSVLFAIAAKQIRSGELLWKKSNVLWGFWLSILVHINRPRYVRTARRCSHVKEWNEMKSENRVIDDENGWKPHF
jgi:hypothetical protein